MLSNLFAALTANPLLASLAITWIIVVLHWPYRYECRRDRRGREHRVWQSAMYRYSYGPRYERLDYHGMRQVQRALASLLRDAWALLRGDILRRLAGALRRRLGL